MHKSLVELAPILLPEPAGVLLVAGWYPCLDHMSRSGWDAVLALTRDALPDDVNRVSESEFEASDAAAVLVVGARQWERSQAFCARRRIPLGAIVCGGNRSRSSVDTGIQRIGVPAIGRPLAWLPPGKREWLELLSPRGRFDIGMLRLQSWMDCLRCLGAGYTLYAAPDSSIISRIIDGIGVDSGLWQHTKSGMLLINAEQHIVKVALLDKAKRALYDSYSNLSELRPVIRGTQMEALVPKKLRDFEVGNFYASIETKLVGQSAFRLATNKKKLRRVFEAATNLLEAWYAGQFQDQPMDQFGFEKYWKKPLSNIQAWLSDKGLAALWASIIGGLERRVFGRHIPLVPQHGDFWLNNLLISPQDEITGIVDWDHAVAHDLPLLDLYHLISWRTDIVLGDFTRRKLIAYLPRSGGWQEDLILRHCQSIGLDQDLAVDLYLTYWLRQIAARSDELFPRKSTVRFLEAVAGVLSHAAYAR